MTIRLDHERLALATAELCAQDPDLEIVVDKFGVPPLWNRSESFRTLLYLILEQQVSLASARATFERLVAWIGSEPTPDTLLLVKDVELRELGFSRQKIRYCRFLAQAILDGSLRLNDLRACSDDSARKELMKIPGIGPWTADVYLMEALGRPDVWPVGDIALAVGVEKVKNLKSRPDQDALMEFGDRWRPHRSVAARILWHYYLCVIRPLAGGKPS